jgi:hypothetical protein
MPTRQIIVGLPWYERTDYRRLKTLFVEGERLPDTYDLWLEYAERTFQEVKARGQLPVKVPIIPAEFVEWCRGRGLRPYAKRLLP